MAPAQGMAEPRRGAGGASGKAPRRKGPALQGVRRKGRGTAPSSQARQGEEDGWGRVPAALRERRQGSRWPHCGPRQSRFFPEEEGRTVGNEGLKLRWGKKVVF